MTALYLGVDAGNTKTAALLCDARGRVLGSGQDGNGDIYGAINPEAAVAAVRAAVLGALNGAGARCEDIRSSAFRLAGVDWPSDGAYWSEVLTRVFPELVVSSIANDGYAAIRCGAPDGTGLAIVVGTGPAIAARNTAIGATWSLGWWAQEHLGAMGLGHAALRAVYGAELGLAPPTSLTQRLLTFYDKDSVAALLESFTRRDDPLSWRHKALAAPEVSAAATESDDIALTIIAQHAHHLIEYAEVAARKTGLLRPGQVVPVVLSGSVLTADQSPLAEALRAALPRRLPQGSAVQALVKPVAGAVLDAMAEAGLENLQRAWTTLAESPVAQISSPF